MLVIGIAGGSGSGKTTFAQKITRQFPTGKVGLLHQDSYYLEELPGELIADGTANFDHPGAFDWELFRNHIVALRNGGSVKVPHYDFENWRRSDKVETVGPCEALLVEGIFSLWQEEIRMLYDIRVFLNVDADIRFIRRLHRDVRERGRTLDGIIRQYYDSVRPMYARYLELTRQYADLIVPEETDVAADMLAAKIRESLRKR